MGQAKRQALLQGRDVAYFEQSLATNPRRIDEGQPHEIRPGRAQIHDVGKALARGEAEIANHERTTAATHEIRDAIVLDLLVARSVAARLPKQLHQDLRSPRGLVEQNRVHLLPGHVPHEHDGAHGAARSDGDARHQAQVVLGSAETSEGHEGEIRVAALHRGGAARGQVIAEFEAILAQKPVFDAIGDGTRVEERHGGEANATHG